MINFNRKDLSPEQLIGLYRGLLLPRMIEEKMLVLLRQGRISKWFSGIGQEAISVGVTAALNSDEWIFPLHRNLGVFTGRGIPFRKLFQQWQGDPGGFSQGRERSFHFGTHEYHICGMISHLGPQLALADGAALAATLRGEEKVAVAFSGEGGTSEGDFHEALNLAAVWDLPVIFVVENNGYGLSTPVREQFRCESIAAKGPGYGMDSVRIDGNNILDVYDTLRGVREFCLRRRKPYLVECMTFRMRGHEEASGTKYVPQALLDEWAAKDPLATYERFLSRLGILTPDSIAAFREEITREIEEGIAVPGEPIVVNTARELADVYAPEPSLPASSEGGETPTMKFFEAIRTGLRQAMHRDETLVLMGQDIAEYGGAFKITEGLLAEFGPARVRNTPLCESAIVGTAMGLAIEGFPSVVEMQFADFVTEGFNQIVNNLAKSHYRWGQNAPVVIRMPTGAGVGAGPFHSQSTEAWFAHVAGLKVVYPSNPADAKGLLLRAIADPNPVLFFEHKALYRSVSGPVPEAPVEIPIGKAAVLREGEDLSVITYGAAVHWALAWCEAHPEASVEILDLRSLLPLDYEAIRATVHRTGKALVLHEDNLTGGIGAEVAAWIGEHCFDRLDAPVVRCAALDTPVPFNLALEKNYLPESRLHEALRRLLEY